jgi:hypothetical protein
MTNPDFLRRLRFASQRVPAVTGGAALRACAGMAAWQIAGSGANDGNGRVPWLGGAMR